MSNCSVLQQSISKKPIELCLMFEGLELDDMFYTLESAKTKPAEWENLVLIASNYRESFDLIYAYNLLVSDGVLYLGHWNDGVVEEV